MRAQVNGTELFFDVHGMSHEPCGHALRERPVLFLLHGGPGGDHSSLKSLAPLADVAQLVWVDHRGSGRSSACDLRTQNLEQNIADVDGLRAYLGLERISVLGLSYGGMVAQGYAIRYPERVSNLVLVATAPSHEFLAEARRIVTERGTIDQQRVCRWLWDGNFESHEQLQEFFAVMAPLYSTTYTPEKFAISWDRGIRNHQQLNLGFGGFLRTFDFRPQLSSIRCPTLVLAGRHDWICPVRQSEQIAAGISRSHLKIFEQSSHGIPGDEPEAFFAAVRGFLTYAPG